MTIFRKVLLSTRNVMVKFIPEHSELNRYLTIIGMRLNAKYLHRKMDTLSMSVNATHHCNLNCKSCTAMSPIADEYFLDIDSYKKDMGRLADLTGGKLRRFTVSGGEPLLHPRITEIFDIARSHFSRATIGFMTNGILLAQMPERFWVNCQHNKIIFSISRYPINLDIGAIDKKAKQFNIPYGYVGGSDVPIKTMWKYPFDVEGKQPLKKSFDLCSQINVCQVMEKGLLYPCVPIAMSQYFNKYFNKKMEILESDTLDLHAVKSVNEIFDFLCSPKPFCRYCNRAGIQLGIQHGVSQREIEEWT
jgi:MoaA/NifB/PqqE/SkfB family radical SAM enzyme